MFVLNLVHMTNVGFLIALTLTTGLGLGLSMNALELGREIDVRAQIDPIITGPTPVDGVAGRVFTVAEINACDADCQAQNAGLSFD